MNSRVKKSVDIAYSLTPKCRNDHFAFIWKRNRLISIGRNDPINQNKKALDFGVRFKVQHFVNFPFLHAEIDAIRKVWGRHKLDSSYTLVSIRLNNGIKNAKPCINCNTVLQALGLKVIYSKGQEQWDSY